MPAINASASAHFPINDRWLERFNGESGHYFDLLEVAKSTPENPCQYLTELRDMKEIANRDINNLIGRAAEIRINGINNGIYVGTSGHISGRLQSDTWTDLWHNLAAGLVHPLRFNRIYPISTTARQIKIVGIAQQ